MEAKFDHLPNASAGDDTKGVCCGIVKLSAAPIYDVETYIYISVAAPKKGLTRRIFGEHLNRAYRARVLKTRNHRYPEAPTRS